MKRLGGIDSAFLGMEAGGVTAHVVAVSVYDPSGSPYAFDLDHARRLLLSRLDRIPAFRRRLVTVPGSFSRPYWIDDPDFDIDEHLHLCEVAAPGGREQFADALATICEGPLDRHRPAWELHVLTGLEGGRVAHVIKMHHAAVDGATGVAILNTLNSPDPTAVEIGEPATWAVDAPPSQLDMLRRGVEDAAGSVRTLLEVGWGAGRELRQVARALGPMLTGRPPRLSFNHLTSPRRSVAFAHLDFSTVRGVSKSTGTTINDVILAACSIALRSWLVERGELPDRPVVAGVPVSTREGPGVEESNQVTAVMAHLPVHLDDPRETLRLVAADMDDLKDRINGVPPDLLERAASLLPPVALSTGASLGGLLRVADVVPMPFNLGISSVPGSRVPLYCTGARLLEHYGFGFFPHGAALNITLNSYVDGFDVSFVTCPDLVSNLWDLADTLPVALSTLAAAIET